MPGRKSQRPGESDASHRECAPAACLRSVVGWPKVRLHSTEAAVSNLKSTVLTPQFILAFVVEAVWCYVAIGGIAEGDDVASWLAVLIGLPVFVVLIGLAIKHAARDD